MTRKEAATAGLKRFNTGLPCRYGHVADRYVSTGQCSQCLMINANSWRERNREHTREYSRQYGKEHQSHRTEYLRQWLATNPEKVKEYDARRAVKRRKTPYGPHARSVAKANGSVTYLGSRPCKRGHLGLRYTSSGTCTICFVIDQKALNETNPNLRRVISQNRRARERAAVGKYNSKQIDALLVAQKRRCVYCRASLKAGYHIDHRMPLALGGSNEITNIQLLCQSCNQRKHAKHPIAFAQEMGILL